MQNPPPAERPLLPKVRAAQPFIFNSNPVRTSLKKPIFKGKSPPNSSLHLETSDLEDKEGKKTISLAKETEAGLLKQEAPCTFSEVEEKTDGGTALLSWEDEALAASDEEDETKFFTPELFEGKDDDGSPRNETTESPAAWSDELFEQVQGQASINGQSVSVSERTKPEGEDEGIRGQEEGVEGGQVDNKSRQRDSLSRMSRSRQKGLINPTGN